MNIIEVMQFRSFSQADKHKVVSVFDGLEISGDKRPYKISLFKNETLPTDLTIFLYWDQSCLSRAKSDFAVKLSSALKHFGWIAHSVWKPLKEKSSC